MGYIHFSFPTLGSRLVFWHQEVASGPFCLLVNSPWLLVFALLIFFFSLSFFNLCCWKGIYFSNAWSGPKVGGIGNQDFVFLCLFFGLIISFHFWFRDLLRELNKKYEILLMVLFLVFFYFLGVKLCYLYPSFGHLFIHYLLQVWGFGLEKVSM